MTTYKYFKTKNSPLFPKSLHGNSYRLIMVEGSILLDLAHLPVLCLIQVLTLVVCTWSAVDSGHAGRDERQLEVSVFACAGVVLDMNDNESIGANAVGWWIWTSRESFYSPKRAGVRLGVMGASSFLPGVQIFTTLNQRKMSQKMSLMRRYDILCSLILYYV